MYLITYTYHACMNKDYTIMCFYINYIQVAALAPLALLLVLEARCAHFVIVHFKNFFVL